MLKKSWISPHTHTLSLSLSIRPFFSTLLFTWKSFLHLCRCLATNSVAGKERHSNGISVTVLERGEGDNYKLPSFLSPKDPVRVVQGENAIIECLATGVPLPTISWQRKCKFQYYCCIISISVYLSSARNYVAMGQTECRVRSIYLESNTFYKDIYQTISAV